jgi:hypothetical protein
MQLLETSERYSVAFQQDPFLLLNAALWYRSSESKRDKDESDVEA